ncbi:signal peptidase I [Pseudonocardia kujensis]|uniref:signal peptidase I n=1 Tax=Pseudonocardia kujensis TaxID=1128675 RepID=UPI001E6577B9|nr:signal peptidase I [Pseudonocardia kujensis]MCE0762669.1 signal peptidase I [Pseudonocardia kujensis]
MASHARTADAEQETARHAAPPPRVHPLRRALDLVLGLVVLVVVALAAAVALVPVVVGGHSLTVLSGSMEPTLPVGSVAVVKPVDTAQVKPGDVLNFTDRDAATGRTRIVMHRVVEVRPGPEFVTKGDANRTADPDPVAAQDVHGVLWYDVPYVGGLRDRLVSPAGLAIAGGIVLLAIAVALLVPKHTRER